MCNQVSWGDVLAFLEGWALTAFVVRVFRAIVPPHDDAVTLLCRPVARDPDKDVPAAPRHVAAMLRQETPRLFRRILDAVLPTNVEDAFQLLTSLLASPFVSGPAAGPVPAFVVDAVLDLPVPRLTPLAIPRNATQIKA